MIVWSILNSIRSIKKATKKKQEEKLKNNKIVPNIENEGLIPKKNFIKKKIDNTPMVEKSPQESNNKSNRKESNDKLIEERKIMSPSPMINSSPLTKSPSYGKIDEMVENEEHLNTIPLEEDNTKRNDDFEKKEDEERKEDEAQKIDSKISSPNNKIENKTKGSQIKQEEDDVDRSSIYIKILFNYMQILSVLGTFPFSWPEQLVGLFSQNKDAVNSSQSFFSIDCFLKQDVFSKVDMRVFFTKLLLYALSPFGFVMISFVAWLIYFYAKYRFNMKLHKAEFNSFFITTIVILLFMVHPNIIQQDFSAFS